MTEQPDSLEDRLERRFAQRPQQLALPLDDDVEIKREQIRNAQAAAKVEVERMHDEVIRWTRINGGEWEWTP